MKPLFLLSIALLLLPSFQASAQNQKIDSLRVNVKSAKTDAVKTIALSHLAFAYIGIRKDSAYAIAERALKLAQKNNDQNGFASAYNTLGWIYFTDGDSTKAVDYITKAITFYKKTNDQEQLITSYSNLATIYLQQVQYDMAIENLMKCVKIMEKTHSDSECLVYKNLGVVYRKLKDYGTAEKYFLKAITTAKDIKNKCAIRNSLGIMYQEMGNFDKALKEYNSTLKEAKQQNDLYSAAMSYENMGTLFASLEQYDKARIYTYKARDNYESLGNKADIIYINTAIGGLESISGNYDKAISILKNALLLCNETTYVNYRADIIGKLAIVYENKGEYEEALKTYKASYLLRDSINYDKQIEKFEELRAQFEADQKDKEIELLNKNKAIQQQKITQRNTQLLVSLLLILLILTAIAFIINRSRLKQRNKELELRNRIASDLHDDVGSSLSSIRLLNEMARETKNDSPEMLEKISSNIKETIESMGDIVWMIKPESKQASAASLENRMKKFLTEICNSSHKECDFKEDNNDSVELDMLHKRNIYLIFKEAVNNAVKYADCKKITISFSVHEKMLVLIIADDGKGFDANKNAFGNGLENMEQRAKDINGALDIVSENEKGTTITLSVRL
ncbi:tetratricopeptide repeat protein [Flavobacterium sp. 3HN19-14]|uniref:tetratricopeptide repeat-containing sensor histidine kinase n=1 Tax=Flavobacterium sp. 3HN19-14 TaxID=3448133 RepID=UPI003EE330A3